MDDLDIMNARADMYKAEKETIKTWLNQIGCEEPVGYWYNYGERNLVLYTNRPGQLIGKGGAGIDILKDMLAKQFVGSWTVQLIEVKGGFVT